MLKLIGLILPPLVDVATSHVQGTNKRFFVSLAICGLFGAGVNFVEHNGLVGYYGLTMLAVVDSISLSILAMFGLAQISYKLGWENSDLRNNIGANAKTNGVDNSEHL